MLIYGAAAIAAALAAFVPTPYSLILPGRAVNLGGVIALPHHSVVAKNLYLTDVRFATHVTVLELLAGFLPGARIVRTGDVLPRGITAAEFEGVQREAMAESQVMAAAVAERAAGYPVPEPRANVTVVSLLPRSPAAAALHPLDVLRSLESQTVTSDRDLRAILRKKTPGTIVHVGVIRRGVARMIAIRTVAFRGRTVIGAYLTMLYERPRLPIPIVFHLPGVAGSSGGLMFALDIYRSLEHKPLPDRLRVAGTGTIDYDGTVGPIEGAAQKVVAAREAGASIFIVPAENYDQVKGTRGIRILPVATFGQAAQALDALSPSRKA